MTASEEVKARGTADNPYDSVDDALAALTDDKFYVHSVNVTKAVYDAFDWRDHVGLAKAGSHNVVMGMNDSEDVACVKVVDRTSWRRGSAEEAFAWELGWRNASKKQMEWLLDMARRGWKDWKPSSTAEMEVEE